MAITSPSAVSSTAGFLTIYTDTKNSYLRLVNNRRSCNILESTEIGNCKGPALNIIDFQFVCTGNFRQESPLYEPGR